MPTRRRSDEKQAFEMIAAAARGLHHVRQVVLFGSRARGETHAFSDMDVLLLLDEAADADRCRMLSRDAADRAGVSADVIVRTVSSFANRRDDPGTLDYQIAREGRTLYLRSDCTDVLSRPSRVRERPPASEPLSVAEWVDRAERDLVAMRVIAALERPVCDVICFHAHQAVEKLLKAVVITGFTAPPRTHSLRDLLDICPAQLRNSRRAAECCTLLDALYPRTRYPDLLTPDLEEARRASLAAEEMRERLLVLLGRWPQ